jgi:hypothetical protein
MAWADTDNPVYSIEINEILALKVSASKVQQIMARLQDRPRAQLQFTGQHSTLNPEPRVTL